MEVHEAENWLLDQSALAGSALNTGGRTPAQIEQRLVAHAKQLEWWIACRTVIMELRKDFREEFLEHPRLTDAPDLAAAEKWIINQPWFIELQARTRAATAARAISTKLAQAHTLAVAQVANGQWRQIFSGKELYRHVRGWIYTKPLDRNANSNDLDIDLAKSVAEWQVRNNAIPSEVVDLRLALRTRVGI
jgi:hypothetical protein